MAFKQKKRLKNACNKYLKSRALAQLRDGRTTTRSCTDMGKKRVALDSEKSKLDLLHQEEVTVHRDAPVASPVRSNSQTQVDGNKQQELPGSPKTPEGTDCDNESRLECLPMDLLVCNDKVLIGPFFFIVVLNYFGILHFYFYLISDMNSGLSSGFKVKIICHLHHDQLKAVFHVSQRIRAAVSVVFCCSISLDLEVIFLV